MRTLRCVLFHFKHWKRKYVWAGELHNPGASDLLFVQRWCTKCERKWSY